MGKFLKLIIIAISVGMLAGICSWSFLHSINFAIMFRKEHAWIIYFLPIVGVIVSWCYMQLGKGIDSGSQLILEEIHSPQKHIAFRMVPMIFLSTVISHLFGASVGREGAAVQMGAGISDQFAKYFPKMISSRRVVLMIGISAGFAAIFGTPIAGALFGVEVLIVGAENIEAIFPCFLAAWVGHNSAMFLGVHHTLFPHPLVSEIQSWGILSSVIVGLCAGMVVRLFVWSMRSVKKMVSQITTNPILRPMTGGVVIIIFYFMMGNDRYLSLGEDVINESFIGHVHPWDFLGKIFSSSFSIGSGFRGGEVMSLFYIGATLGNSLSHILPLALPVLAALGFTAVFAGAANTPFASLFLALELFGSNITLYVFVAIIVSVMFSGKKGIYQNQTKYLIKKL